MEWKIESFRGMGPIKFGMSADDVRKNIGPVIRTRKGLRADSFTEFRGVNIPIIRYRNGVVSEIEAFHEVPGVSLGELYIFEGRGLTVLRELEKLNGGALQSVGVVLFTNLGITVGRLDENVPEQHSITAFEAGLWDQKIRSFAKFSFV